MFRYRKVFVYEARPSEFPFNMRLWGSIYSYHVVPHTWSSDSTASVSASWTLEWIWTHADVDGPGSQRKRVGEFLSSGACSWTQLCLGNMAHRLEKAFLFLTNCRNAVESMSFSSLGGKYRIWLHVSAISLRTQDFTRISFPMFDNKLTLTNGPKVIHWFLSWLEAPCAYSMWGEWMRRRGEASLLGVPGP